MLSNMPTNLFVEIKSFYVLSFKSILLFITMSLLVTSKIDSLISVYFFLFRKKSFVAC
jgi:hypothetical protein